MKFPYCLGKFKFCVFCSSPQMDMKKPHGKTPAFCFGLLELESPGDERWKGAMLWSDSTVSKIH